MRAVSTETISFSDPFRWRDGHTFKRSTRNVVAHGYAGAAVETVGRAVAR